MKSLCVITIKLNTLTDVPYQMTVDGAICLRMWKTVKETDDRVITELQCTISTRLLIILKGIGVLVLLPGVGGSVSMMVMLLGIVVVGPFLVCWSDTETEGTRQMKLIGQRVECFIWCRTWCFLVMLSICLFQERFEEMVTPRYLAWSVVFNTLLWCLG